MFGIWLLVGLIHFSTAITVQTNICGLPGIPAITAPSDGTSTSTQAVTVDGTADDNIAVNILDNNQLVASTTADSSGNFGVSFELSSGSNVIVAQAENNCSQVADSSSVTDTYTPPAPPPSPPAPAPSSSDTGTTTVPAVTPVVNSASTTTPTTTVEPTFQSAVFSLTIADTATPNTPTEVGSSTSSAPVTQTNAPSILYTGSTGVPANVEIVDNGNVIADVISDKNGDFSVRIPLTVGKNNIKFVAKSGNKTITRYIQVTRVPPVAKKKGPDAFLILVYVAIVIAAFDIFYALLHKSKLGNKKKEQSK